MLRDYLFATDVRRGPAKVGLMREFTGKRKTAPQDKPIISFAVSVTMRASLSRHVPLYTLHKVPFRASEPWKYG